MISRERGMLVAAALVLAASVSAEEPAPGTPWQEAKTGMRFVWIPGGCFDMGASDGGAQELPVHKVCVKGFYLGVYEVTQAQYRQVTGKNPSNIFDDTFPVDSVSWTQATQMAKDLSRQSGQSFRLPSEAEWEYACRAGGRHAVYCGEGMPTELAWFSKNSGQQSWPVGQKKANAWGLHDMSGNVWEWTGDCWHPSYVNAPADGSAWTAGGDCANRVARGGSWGTVTASVRADSRNWNLADNYFTDTGFRLVREP